MINEPGSTTPQEDRQRRPTPLPHVGRNVCAIGNAPAVPGQGLCGQRTRPRGTKREIGMGGAGKGGPS